MSEEEEDKGLRDLFRNKLENAEVIPSESAGSSLMKRLARKEFLHFIPSRFNIWYLGGVVATGSILALLLFTNPGKYTEKQPANTSDTTTVVPVNSTGNAILEAPPVKKAEVSNQAPSYERKKRIFAKKTDNTETGNKAGDREREGTTPQNIPGNISGKEIINRQIEGINKLQSDNKGTAGMIIPSVTGGCLPLKVKFKSNIDQPASIRWEFGDGGFSDQKEPEWIFDIAGDYEVQLHFTGKDAAKTVLSTVINVYPKPTARFEISPEDAIIPDNEIQFHNYSTGAVKSKWDFGDGTTSELFEPRHKYARFGNYDLKLISFSEYGCTDTVLLVNAFAGNGYYIIFPNAFIPNPDGPSGGYYTPKSDEAGHVFHPAFAGVSDYQLRIFTRRGILVFETDDINIGWDGYFKGQICDQGVYVWKVRGTFVNGETFTKMGDVTLLRTRQN